VSVAASKRLRELFASGGCELDGAVLKFEGSVGRYSDGREELEAALGYRLPDDVAQFLREFGGTRLFVNEYGLGIRVLRLDEVAAVNKNLQETTEPFWPRFAVIGFDSTDDMLCLYRDGDRVHFGNLHHEAWGAPHLWVQEALAFAPFAAWFEMMVASGETIPDKRISYAI
jgi:hypothetical protein